MNLIFSRKTWYLLLTISSAVSMLAVCNALIGQDILVLSRIAFGILGLAILFLAAEKDNDLPTRKGYFFSFLFGMLGYALTGVVSVFCSALLWPTLLYTEYKRGAPLRDRLRLLIFAEVSYLLFWLLANAGNQGVAMFGLVFAVLRVFAQGWAAYTLVRWHAAG